MVLFPDPPTQVCHLRYSHLVTVVHSQVFVVLQYLQWLQWENNCSSAFISHIWHSQIIKKIEPMITIYCFLADRPFVQYKPAQPLLVHHISQKWLKSVLCHICVPIGN